MAFTDGLLTLEQRTADGNGNNLADADLGAANTQFKRLADADYADNVGSIRQGPNAREISNTIVDQEQTTESAFGASDLFTFFGQFIDHDIDLTPAASGEQLVVSIPANDPVFQQGQPITLTRSSVADGTGVNGVAREQTNAITSFADASNVYGSSEEVTKLLRADAGKSAYLLTGDDDSAPTLGQMRSTYPDFDTDHPDLVDGGSRDDMFVGGDIRMNENSALISMHTVWIREHNYQVDRLREEHPTWTEEQLFTGAKIIVEAEYQNVVFNEYVPFLLGAENIPEYQGYDSSIDPSISTEFATAAYRLGHSQLSSVLHRTNEDGSESDSGHLDLFKAFFNPAALGGGDGVDPLVRGLTNSKAQQIDEHIVDDVRNLLFGQGGPGSDLASLNIMRGRDHGIPTLNDMRIALGLPAYASFSDLTSSAELAAQFADVYGSINDVDLWVGGLAEEKVAGSQLGATFHAIVLDQFMRLRDGDRFYFEERLAEFPELLADIKDTNFSDVLLRNTGIDHLQDDVFIAHERIVGSDGYDYLEGTDSHDLIVGRGGHDNLVGLDGDDDLYGGAGDDYLRGFNGNDVVNGDNGDDAMEGGRGDDRMSGGAGNDWMHGGYDDDVIEGGIGHDDMRGGAGNDRMAGDAIKALGPDDVAGDDALNGGRGDDILIGDATHLGDGTVGGDDYLAGKDGNDTLFGDGIDVTAGSIGGNDHLFGGDGNDALYGGSGNDYLDGGAGDLDTAFFTDLFTNYEVVTDQNGITTVQHLDNGADGTDKLIDVEFLSFSDQIVETPDRGQPDPDDTGKITGTDGNDTYVGTSKDDIFVISQGRDTIQGYEKGVDKIHFGENGVTSINELWGSLNDDPNGYLVVGDYHGNQVTIEGVTDWDQFDTDDMTF